jgi:Transcription factor WhiB
MEHYKELDTTLAACTSTDPDLFFPDDSDRWTHLKAMDICALCPIKAACLDVALANNEKHGIWGGANPPARKKMKRDKRYKQTHLNSLAKRAQVLLNTNKGESK